MIEAVQRLLYLRDASKIEAALINRYGHNRTLPSRRDIERILVQSIAPPKKRAYVHDNRWTCGHEQTDDNSELLANGNVVCRECRREKWRAVLRKQEEQVAAKEAAKAAEREKLRKRIVKRTPRVLPQWYKVGGRVPVSAIIYAATSIGNISAMDLLGGSRLRRVARVRWAACIVAAEQGHSLSHIGREIGARDHSTISHAIKQGRDIMECDDAFNELVAKLRVEISRAA
jgi:hypothetical protein